MGEVTREELAAMTDHEQSASEREHHGDPYMTLLQAKGMHYLRNWSSKKISSHATILLRKPCRPSGPVDSGKSATAISPDDSRDDQLSVPGTRKSVATGKADWATSGSSMMIGRM